jgi:hypothetical protein
MELVWGYFCMVMDLEVRHLWNITSEWKVVVRKYQYRGQCDKFLELHKVVFLRQAPVEPNVFHGEVKVCTHVV